MWGELSSEVGRGQARNTDFILSYREKASYVIKVYKYESGDCKTCVWPLSMCVAFLFVTAPFDLWDLSSPTRDQTWAVAVEAWNPNHWTTRECPTGGLF